MEEMAVFEVNIWMISKGKFREHEELMRRMIGYEKANPEKFREQKSFRYFSPWGGAESSRWPCCYVGIRISGRHGEDV